MRDNELIWVSARPGTHAIVDSFSQNKPEKPTFQSLVLKKTRKLTRELSESDVYLSYRRLPTHTVASGRTLFGDLPVMSCCTPNRTARSVAARSCSHSIPAGSRGADTIRCTCAQAASGPESEDEMRRVAIAPATNSGFSSANSANSGRHTAPFRSRSAFSKSDRASLAPKCKFARRRNSSNDRSESPALDSSYM